MVIDDWNHMLLLKCYCCIFIFLFFAEDKISSTTLARVGGIGYRQLAKFHHAAAMAYQNAPAPDLTAGFELSCLLSASKWMCQPNSGVVPTYANPTRKLLPHRPRLLNLQEKRTDTFWKSMVLVWAMATGWWLFQSKPPAN